MTTRGKQIPGAPKPHEQFNVGQGYGSGERTSEFQRKRKSGKQLGDNPLPDSGGGYDGSRPDPYNDGEVAEPPVRRPSKLG
jgi:hypothetical protein